MNKLLLLCLLAVAGQAAAQAPPLHYSAVIDAPGASQADLYGRAVKWMAAAPVVDAAPVRDAAAGLVAARLGSVFTAQSGAGGMPCTLWRRVSVEVKEGRAKYELTDFQVQYYVATAAATEPPTRAQAALHPLEELTAKGGTWGRSMLAAAEEATAGQVAALKAALLTKSDW